MTKVGPFEIQDAVDDIADLAHPAERVEVRQALVGRSIVQRGLDDSEGDGVDPNAACCILDSQRAGHRRESTFGERRQRGGPLAVGWSTRLAVMLTTWPLPCATICRIQRCVMWKNPARFTAVIAV